MWQDGSDIVKLWWQEAIDYCSDLSFGGYSDWRLPDYYELLSIVDSGRYAPAIDPIFENTKSDYYWSSSSLADNRYSWGYAWRVYFNNGIKYNSGKSYGRYVRCVR